MAGGGGGGVEGSAGIGVPVGAGGVASGSCAVLLTPHPPPDNAKQSNRQATLTRDK